MTAPPPDVLDLRAELRRRAGEFLQRFYRHEVLMARAVRGIQIEVLQRFRAEVATPLVQAVAGRLSTFDPRGADVTPGRFPELQQAISEAEQIIERGAASVMSLVRQRLGDVAQGEAKFVAQNAERTADMPVQPVNTADAVDQPFLGDKLERWFSKLLVGPTGDAVRQRITLGIQQGQSVDEIVRSLRGTRSQRGVLDASGMAVYALVRTAATAASANARQIGFEAMGLTHWRFVATLDTRTSVICAANDGKRWPVGQGPMPPLHPNCRSTAVPDFGEAVGTRASIDGQVPASKDFGDWLKTRTVGEQDEVLGRTRAIAWRAGRISLEELLGRDMQPLTLDELRNLDRL